MFGDELFHRYAHGMTPTVRSHALYEPTLQLLSAYGKLFETTTFDPTKLNRIFKIGAVDRAIITFFAPAFTELFKDCPHLSIEFRNPGQSYNRDLIRGDLDMGISPNLIPEPGFHTQVLCQETMVLVVGSSHPLVTLQTQRPLEESDFAPYRLIKVSHAMSVGYDEKWSTTIANIPHVGNGDAAIWTPYFLSVPTMLDSSDFLAIFPLHLANQMALRHRLHILGVGNGDAAIWTPYFLSVPTMLDSSDFLAIFPLHLANQMALRHRLHILGRPENAPIFSPTLLWHDRTHFDPASQWFRAKIISQCRAYQNPLDLPVFHQHCCGTIERILIQPHNGSEQKLFLNAALIKIL